MLLETSYQKLHNNKCAAQQFVEQLKELFWSDSRGCGRIVQKKKNFPFSFMSEHLYVTDTFYLSETHTVVIFFHFGQLFQGHLVSRRKRKQEVAEVSNVGVQTS